MSTQRLMAAALTNTQSIWTDKHVKSFVCLGWSGVSADGPRSAAEGSAAGQLSSSAPTPACWTGSSRPGSWPAFTWSHSSSNSSSSPSYSSNTLVTPPLPPPYSPSPLYGPPLYCPPSSSFLYVYN